jgi:hypothetical protein
MITTARRQTNMPGISATHIAYADESYYTSSRHRSIAVITCKASDDDTITQLYTQLLRESGLREFKWEKLRQARERFAALKMMDRAIELSTSGRLRVDVLIWDTYDSRHSVQGRDDVANLQRMYYQLFKNVLQQRWPTGSTWHLRPDENSALDWATVQDYLDSAGLTIQVQGNLLEGSFRLRLARDFSVLQICEACSLDTPLCQLADLFAGIGAYSHAAYDKYECWLCTQSGQMALDLDLDDRSPDPQLSNKDRERCTVIKHLDDQCKRHKLHVGLKSSRGLRTYDPTYPINFWPYEPQHPDDKAPVRVQGTEY